VCLWSAQCPTVRQGTLRLPYQVSHASFCPVSDALLTAARYAPDRVHLWSLSDLREPVDAYFCPLQSMPPHELQTGVTDFAWLPHPHATTAQSAHDPSHLLTWSPRESLLRCWPYRSAPQVDLTSSQHRFGGSGALRRRSHTDRELLSLSLQPDRELIRHQHALTTDGSAPLSVADDARSCSINTLTHESPYSLDRTSPSNPTDLHHNQHPPQQQQHQHQQQGQQQQQQQQHQQPPPPSPPPHTEEKDVGLSKIPGDLDAIDLMAGRKRSPRELPSPPRGMLSPLVARKLDLSLGGRFSRGDQRRRAGSLPPRSMLTENQPSFLLPPVHSSPDEQTDQSALLDTRSFLHSGRDSAIPCPRLGGVCFGPRGAHTLSLS
jgi:hypothetical protein